MSYQDEKWEDRLAVATKSESDAAKAISDNVNVMFDPAVVGALLARNSHRTLQQGFTSLAVGFIEEMARMHKEGFTDARNEASAEFCAKVTEAMAGEVPFQFKSGSRFPFI